MLANMVPGIILGLREGLEAFLIISIMLKYLEKIDRPDLEKPVKLGMLIGIAGSVVIGLAIWGAVALLKGSSENIGKLWESVASIAGLALLSTFIFWMMKHGKTMTTDVQRQVAAKVSRTGIGSLAAVVVLREGVEISLFAFSSAGEEAYVIGVVIGVALAAVLAYLIFRSLVRVNLAALFTITLGYLVLQAGYLLGYAVHEFLSALKDLGTTDSGSWVYVKAFNLADTVLDHKTGALGVPLNVLLGWYSRPEWVQACLHYGYVAAMLILWWRTSLRERRPSTVESR